VFKSHNTACFANVSIGSNHPLTCSRPVAIFTTPCDGNVRYGHYFLPARETDQLKRSLPSDLFLQLSHRGDAQQFAKGEVLFEEGDPPDGV
jgi:hypothetical protein